MRDTIICEVCYKYIKESIDGNKVWSIAEQVIAADSTRISHGRNRIHQSSVVMTFIDWSDSEGMLELLAEFVSDAKNECLKDVKRQQFLSALFIQLNELVQQFSNTQDAINRLRSTYNSIDPEFKDDAVTIHVNDCIEELERSFHDHD